MKTGKATHLHPSGPADPTSHLDPALRVSRLPGAGLAVAGEVDVATRRTWRSTLESLVVNGTPARLDMSGLSFIDAHGTAALMAAARRMAPGKTLTLHDPPYCLRRVLDLFWPDELLEITIEDGETG